MDSQEYLAENRGLVVSLASKYFMETPKFDFDDLVSVGNKAALRALDTFDYDRGEAKVSTYVHKAVEHDIANFVRKNKFDLYVSPYQQKKAHKRRTSGEANVDLSNFGATHSPLAIPLSGNADEKGVPMAETIPSGAPPIPETLIKKEQIDILMEEVDLLPNRERDVIMARFFDGARLRDIASDFGVSKQRVQQIQMQALNRLKGKVIHRLDGAMVD